MVFIAIGIIVVIGVVCYFKLSRGVFKEEAQEISEVIATFNQDISVKRVGRFKYWGEQGNKSSMFERKIFEMKFDKSKNILSLNCGSGISLLVYNPSQIISNKKRFAIINANSIREIKIASENEVEYDMEFKDKGEYVLYKKTSLKGASIKFRYTKEEGVCALELV